MYIYIYRIELFTIDEYLFFVYLGLFEQRCIEYFEEVNKLKYEKNNKLNKTVKQIGDLFKDWTTTSSF